ncbi:protein-export chaperone SecB [Lactiplantibacillus plantarum]|uniref:protein-export chaperone SecB n=2 Tax=Lactiplantibacillus plantarum TaxID=1590 RepID=UPI0013E8AD76|nr:protein-export chaperone SecB [Lactiplantibacillus plantarum]MDG2544713.1 protein-export chaperone SecB [Lactiplantibacillus plantarum]
MEHTNGPVIKFQGYRIKKIKYNLYTPDDFNTKISDEGTEKLSFSISLSDDHKVGQVEMKTGFSNESNFQIGEVSVIGQFNINPAVTEREQIKMYLSQNGAAMLYPYVRVITSMITALDKGNVSILKTVNFTEFSE